MPLNRRGLSEWPTAWPADRRRHAQPKTGPATDWQDDAACRTAPEDFVELASQQAGSPLAERWCARCPVRNTCATYGQESRAWGLWGGRVLIDGHPAPARYIPSERWAEHQNP